MVEIRVPTLGESVTAATIGQWLKKEGDTVAADEPIVELETDKVSVEVPAPAAGVLSKISAQEGDTVELNALLGEIGGEAGKASSSAAKADQSSSKGSSKAAAAGGLSEAKENAGEEVQIVAPSSGESVSEADIGEWLVKVGDPVKLDDPVVSLETDKAAVDVPAPASGVLKEIVAQEGDTVLDLCAGAGGKTLALADGQSLAFDKLVLATGATHSYFGKDEWVAHAPGLKTVEDGVAVRGTILNAFEKAEASDDPERIKRLLTFVIVGAGPTGVELAGAIAELAKLSVEREFRTVDPASARVILVQSVPRILPAFPEELSAKAQESLEALGVDIRTRSRVTHIGETQVRIGEEEVIETETVLWAAGVAAAPAAKWLGAKADRSGRVEVDERMRVVGADDEPIDHIFAIGDTAGSTAWDGKPVPGLAPAAKQAGAYVSDVVEAELLGADCPGPFVYKHQGSLATIGRKSAGADFGACKLSGARAWWLWGLVHVGFLTGARNRVTVVINWGWNFFAQHSGIRLITGRD